MRRHGKYFVFVDIVNQFHTIQGMVNWSKVSENSDITKKQFRLFARMLERGDHICKLCPGFICLLVHRPPSLRSEKHPANAT